MGESQAALDKGPCSGGSDEELQPQVMLCLPRGVVPGEVMRRVRVGVTTQGKLLSHLTCLMNLFESPFPVRNQN